jgi:uncharacterized Zn finger protein
MTPGASMDAMMRAGPPHNSQVETSIANTRRRRCAARLAAGLRKKGQSLSPVPASRGAIARTFWGKAWCENLERYSDFSNRLPRGRTYARNGSVIDLRIEAGAIVAQVMGSSLYKIKVTIAEVRKPHWQAIGKDCAGSIDSLVELLQGRFSQGVMARICQPGTGLFPSPREIKFTCSCPDWAGMCKHVAAVFYGIGARLDAQPELLFTLRKVDAKDLLAKAGTGLPLKKKTPSAGRVLDNANLGEVFGIDMADAATPPVPVAARKSRRIVSGRKKAVVRKKKR